METLTHIKKLANPNYIGSYELMTGDTPTELTVIIEKVVKEPVQNGDKKEDCTVMYIKGQKPMILNATNRKSLEKATGTPFIERMVGKKVTLHVVKTKAFGDTVDALRIKPEAPVLPAFTPQHPKWNDAITALKAGNTNIETIKRSYIISAENEKILASHVPAKTV